MNHLLNHTKWEEIRLSMYNLAINIKLAIKWRVKNIDNGYVSAWDSEWYYHFKNGGYEMIEWLEILTPDPSIQAFVLKELKKIHVPGKVQPESVLVYGYSNDLVDYL